MKEGRKKERGEDAPGGEAEVDVDEERGHEYSGCAV
jgi:hypothetical protein